MDHLKLDLWTYDVSEDPGSAEACVRNLIERVQASWDDGADLVAFPEFSWMALERYVSQENKIAGVSELFWRKFWPQLQSELSREGKAVLLGTAPFLDDDGILKNRAPIVSDGSIFYQDKIHLTPWENAFSSGGGLRIWKFRDLKIAVIICLDIEIPELSAALRGKEIDLLLVPSATETLLGVERVGRCANARAVELGCYVAVCQLVGKMDSELIDENLGRLSVYTPSQAGFRNELRIDESPLILEGFQNRVFDLDMALLRKNRAQREETDPSKVRTTSIALFE